MPFPLAAILGAVGTGTQMMSQNQQQMGYQPYSSYPQFGQQQFGNISSPNYYGTWSPQMGSGYGNLYQTPTAYEGAADPFTGGYTQPLQSDYGISGATPSYSGMYNTASPVYTGEATTNGGGEGGGSNFDWAGLVGGVLKSGAAMGGGTSEGMSAKERQLGAFYNIHDPFLYGMYTKFRSAFRAGNESAENKAARRSWERRVQDAMTLLPSLFNNAAAEGMFSPYGQNYGRYSYAPSEAMQSLTNAYLQREYGLSDAIASAMSSQALGPLKLGALPGQGISSQQAAMAGMVNPQQAAQAAIGTQQPGVLRQMDYLGNAAQLGALNQWRAQQLAAMVS